MRPGLRRAGIIASGIGAMASVAMLVYVGNRTGSNKVQPIVMILIAIWVLSPYVILMAGNGLSRSWSDVSRTTLYWMMIVVALISLIVYIPVGLGPVRPKPAAPFVGIPPLQWLLIVAALFVAARVSRQKMA